MLKFAEHSCEIDSALIYMEKMVFFLCLKRNIYAAINFQFGIISLGSYYVSGG